MHYIEYVLDPYIYHTFELLSPKCGAQNHGRNERLNRFRQILFANENYAITSNSTTSTTLVMNENEVQFK